MQSDDVWFPARKFGYGWGFPRCWQGWLVVIIYIALLGGGARFIVERKGGVFFTAYAAVVTVLFLLVCWRKGAPLRWRWGKD